MMFFSRKKEKDEMPVVAKKPPKPPVPPKRHFFNIGTEKPTVTTTLRESSSITTTASSSVSEMVATPSGAIDGNGIYGNVQRPPNLLMPTSPVPYDEMVSPNQSLAVFGSLKEFDLPGLQLPALQAVQVQQRTLTLQKTITGDFGFSIRRVQFPVCGEMKSIVFAEPTQIKAGPPRPHDIKNNLLPGDQLVQVNGHRVESLSREQLQEIVSNAENEIVLVVRSVPELAEFCDRHRGARDTGDSLLLPMVDTTLRENIPEEERMWLMHKGGYTMCRMKEMLQDGRVVITVAGHEMVVDSTDVDRANPSAVDRTPDIAGLRYLNETSTVHLLRQRYGSSLSYTNAGSQSLVCMTLEQEPGVQERLIALFRGCRRGQMPPHVCATAQQVYRHVQMSGNPQSVLFTGVSGSGKSTQVRLFAQYMTAVAGWTRALPFSRLSLALGVVEAFTNAATHLHRDSTRCAQLLQIGFDKAAAVRCAKIQCALLESDRVMRRPKGESSFHVFYYLWEGLDETARKELELDKIDTPMISPLNTAEDKEQAKEAWTRLISAFTELGATADKVKAVYTILGALFHLVRAEATPGAANRAHFLRKNHADIAARLLGVSTESLEQAVFKHTVGLASGTSLGRFSLSTRGAEGPDALSHFCAALYSELFYAILDLVNNALSANAACTWVTLVDVPGSTFNSEWRDSKRTCGLNDLVYNYVNERVAELFHDKNFSEMEEVYTREQVEVDVQPSVGSPHPLNRLLDQKQQLLNCTDLERRIEERRGLFSVLEEESVFPGASDQSLIERIFMHLGDQKRLIRRGSSPDQFIVSHGLGSHRTCYNVKDWIRQAQPSEAATAVRKLLLNSSANDIRGVVIPPGIGSSDSTLRLRRATQTAMVDGVGRRVLSGFAANIAQQLDYVFSVVRRAPRTHFIHCIQPSPTSPTSSFTSSLITSYSSSSSNQMLSHSSSPEVDVPFVRSQIRSLLLIDAVRSNNTGYPERVSYRDFRRRFGCLIDESPAKGATIDETIDDRSCVQKILNEMDIHENRYRLGISQILLRADVLTEMEDRRELSLSGLIVSFQHECRKYLAVKWLHKRRVLDTAIRCIQKNGLSFMAVREWPWWKLHTRVRPLLPLNRADEEQRLWIERIEKLESTLHELSLAKKRSESRVAELEETLDREADASEQLRRALDRETQARMHSDRALAGDDRVSRVSSSSRLESVPSDQKVTELREELEKAKRAEQELKVKTAKTVSQLGEVRREAEELKATNQTLEKKQARFDEELRAVQAQVDEVRTLKERAEKEREEALTGQIKKKNDVEELRLENSELRANVSRLRRELDEHSERSGVVDADEVVVLKKTKRDLEEKTHDLELELDDLVAEKTQAKQTATRLELQVEKLKADAQRESRVRDEELDEIRAQYQRRVRGFEEQISELQDANSGLLMHNRSLEQRLRGQDAASVSWELSGGHYKSELRKALALLADTQAILAHERESAPPQALVRQLRQHLDDAEAAKLAAIKSKLGLDSELNELRTQLEQALVGKSAAEDKVMSLLKEKNSGLALIDEKDELLQLMMKKYKQAVQQHHIDGIAIADYVERIADLEKAKHKLSDELNESQSQLEMMQQHTVEKHKFILAERKIHELEAKLDLEQLHRMKLESQVVRLTDEAESTNEQLGEAVTAREKEAELGRKTRKEMAVLNENMESLRKRDTELQHKLKLLRSENEKLEENARVSQAEMKLAQRRIDALQNALSDGLGEEDDQDSLNGLDDDDDVIGDDQGLRETRQADSFQEESSAGMNIL